MVRNLPYPEQEWENVQVKLAIESLVDNRVKLEVLPNSLFIDSHALGRVIIRSSSR